MSSDVGVQYNDSHRAFVQAFFARSTMTLEQAQQVLAEILEQYEEREYTPDDITTELFQRHIATLNSRLSPLDLEIRSTRSQHDRTQIWALINTTSDDLTQLATPHAPAELAFVRRVLDAMFETHNTPRAEVMAVRGTQALNLHKPPRNPRPSGAAGEDGEQTQQTQGGAAAQGITMKEAERVLKEMTEEGWFEYSKGGFYSLSPRALLELRGWLVEMYNEPDGGDGEGVRRIKFCEACREIVTVGQRCANYDCLCRLHNACTQQIFLNQRNPTCPRCQTAWSGRDFVGEKAAPRGRG